MKKKESSSSVLVIAAIIGIAWLVNQTPATKPKPDNVPQVAVSESVIALKQVASTGDRAATAKLASLYSDFAEVLSRVEPGSLQSSQLRTWLIKSDTYLIRGTNMVGAVPGFGAAKDKVIEEALGMEDKPLDAPELAKAVAACKSIAQALQ
jgi:hypothetical protein